MKPTSHCLCCAQVLSHVRLFCNPWTVAHQAPLSMGILQARILEWVAMPSSRGSSQPKDQTQVSCTAGVFFTICATRENQEYWSGQTIPSPGKLPNPGIELGSIELEADSLPAELPGKPSHCLVLVKNKEETYRTECALWIPITLKPLLVNFVQASFIPKRNELT